MIINELDLLHISTAMLFLYLFVKCKVYFFLWFSVLNIINLVGNKTIYDKLHLKSIIAVYVIIIITFYIFNNRGLLFSKIKFEKIQKMNTERFDKKTILPFLIWLIFNIATKVIYKKIFQ